MDYSQSDSQHIADSTRPMSAVLVVYITILYVPSTTVTLLPWSYLILARRLTPLTTPPVHRAFHPQDQVFCHRAVTGLVSLIPNSTYAGVYRQLWSQSHRPQNSHIGCSTGLEHRPSAIHLVHKKVGHVNLATPPLGVIHHPLCSTRRG